MALSVCSEFLKQTGEQADRWMTLGERITGVSPWWREDEVKTAAKRW